MNLAGIVEKWALERPKDVAVVFEGKETSFRDLNRSINRAANGLRTLGVMEGDRVAVMLPNTPEFLHVFYGCQKIGAVAVPFNTMYKSAEIQYILKDCGAKAVVCQTNFVQLVNEVRSGLPALEHVITTGERMLTFADPDATMFVQAVVSTSVFSSVDDAYRRTGKALVEACQALGVPDAEYCHMGAVRVRGRKLCGCTVSELEDLYLVNALCFVDTFDPTDFFSAIWVPPEIKDKMVEPLTSIAEHRGERPRPDEVRDAVAASMAEHVGGQLVEAAMTREEKFGYEKQRALLKQNRRAPSPSEGRRHKGLLARLFGAK